MRGEEHDDTWRYEDRFIKILSADYGNDANNWEVLQISSGVPAFLVNINRCIIDDLLLSKLRNCLVSCLPELCVFVHVLDGCINDANTNAIGAIAITESDIWIYMGRCSIGA